VNRVYYVYWMVLIARGVLESIAVCKRIYWFTFGVAKNETA